MTLGKMLCNDLPSVRQPTSSSYSGHQGQILFLWESSGRMTPFLHIPGPPRGLSPVGGVREIS